MTKLTVSRSILRRSALGLALSALVGLAACGGGGGGDLTTKVSGTVVDGPIRGATVFLDLNANFVHDAGEPISLPSAADGGFEVVVGNITQAQLAMAMFVSHVPQTAFDADDAGLNLAAAGRQGFTLATPASAYLQLADGQLSAARPLLSPLTTLVTAEMAFNGLSIADARARVQQRAALGSKNPMEDFVVSDDQELGDKARIVAIALGEIAKQISAQAQAGAGPAMRDFVAQTVAALQAALPSLLTAAGVQGGSTAPIPVDDVLVRLPTQN